MSQRRWPESGDAGRRFLRRYNRLTGVHNQMMTKRVREILGYYDAESPGVRANLARLMNHGRLGGTGRFVILPVDQGFEHGPARSFAPNPAGYDPRYHFELALAAGCNA